MEKLDFVFKKKRDIGSLISDYFDFFKKTFKHFHKVIFSLTWPFFLLFIVITYLGITYGRTVYLNEQFNDGIIIALAIIAAYGILLLFSISISMFCVEYMLILEKNRSIEFSSYDVLISVKTNFMKYIKFGFASFLINLVLSIPLIIIYIILSFIPFATYIFIAAYGIYFYVAMLLYHENRYSLMDCFKNTYGLIKSKLFAYTTAGFIFQLIIGTVMGLVIAVPIIIIFILSINSLESWFSIENFFDTAFGKSIITICILLLIVIIILSSMYTISFNSLIYFSTIEENFQEETIDDIDLIGTFQEDY